MGDSENPPPEPTETASSSPDSDHATLDPLTHDTLSFEDFEDSFVVGSYISDDDHSMRARTGEEDLRLDAADMPGTDDLDDDLPGSGGEAVCDPKPQRGRKRVITPGTGGADGASKPQRGRGGLEKKSPSLTPVGDVGSRRRQRKKSTRTRKRQPRTDSLPRSRLRMNRIPANADTKEIAARAILAASVDQSPQTHQLI